MFRFRDKKILFIAIGAIVFSLQGVGFYFVVLGGKFPFAREEQAYPGSRAVFSEPAQIQQPEISLPNEPAAAPSESAPVEEEISSSAAESPPQESAVPYPTPYVTPYSSPYSTPQAEPELQPEPRQPKLHIVSLEADQFMPKFLTITVGDTVRFVNNDNALHWPSADPHPTHTSLPEFDPLADLSPGEFFDFTFQGVGAVGYHDHTAALEEDETTITGTIRVLE